MACLHERCTERHRTDGSQVSTSATTVRRLQLPPDGPYGSHPPSPALAPTLRSLLSPSYTPSYKLFELTLTWAVQTHPSPDTYDTYCRFRLVARAARAATRLHSLAIHSISRFTDLLRTIGSDTSLDPSTLTILGHSDTILPMHSLHPSLLSHSSLYQRPRHP